MFKKIILSEFSRLMLFCIAVEIEITKGNITTRIWSLITDVHMLQILQLRFQFCLHGNSDNVSLNVITCNTKHCTYVKFSLNYLHFHNILKRETLFVLGHDWLRHFVF